MRAVEPSPIRPVRPGPRPRRRSAGSGLSGVAVAGAAALAVAGALFGAAGPATAVSPDVEVVRNGGFDQGNLMVFWNCEEGVAPFSRDALGRGLEGRPGSNGYAGCTQQVPVEANATYHLRAVVAGSYAFVGVTGSGTADVSNWSSSTGWTTLTATVTTGPGTSSLTVYFHGWYGQDPYQIADFSLIGPGTPPDCPTATATATATATPSPSPSSCASTPYPSHT
ncbi:carbohydrate binding domain-containing protein [Kitasatospora sp. NPDC058965]|uniref:carbohydrate binding domain-containing protein n=1 Tax=Kitasatospora sp. NPDC058965 TaxID=3346682 RepID=UPI0036B70C12